MTNDKAQNLKLKFHLIFGFWNLTFLVGIWILAFKIDDLVKSRNQTAKKKDPDARRANPEE